MQLLCRNRVTDFDAWRAVFDADLEGARAAGLVLRHLWVSRDDPNEAFFLFEVAERAKAEAFMRAPEAVESAERSGVIDGDYWFVSQADDR